MHIPLSVLRARATLFWPKIARELTKSDGTGTIRSEIARGIVSNRSRGPEMDKMMVFSIFTAIEMALQLPRRGNSIQCQICTRQVQARGLSDTFLRTRTAPEHKKNYFFHKIKWDRDHSIGNCTRNRFQ